MNMVLSASFSKAIFPSEIKVSFTEFSRVEQSLNVLPKGYAFGKNMRVLSNQSLVSKYQKTAVRIHHRA